MMNICIGNQNILIYDRIIQYIYRNNEIIKQMFMQNHIYIHIDKKKLYNLIKIT